MAGNVILHLLNFLHAQHRGAEVAFVICKLDYCNSVLAGLLSAEQY